jgi:hypothetical protein
MTSKMTGRTRVMGYLILATTLSLTACAAPAQDVVVIRYNEGGDMIDFINERSRMQGSGKTYRIDGFCASACAMFLSLPNVCVTPRSKLGFHRGDGLWEVFRDAYIVHLPPAMRGWYVANAETTRTVFITGSQAIALGANACN